jgi:hypothetical protein
MHGNADLAWAPIYRWPEMTRNDNPYPVFKGGTAAETAGRSTQGRSGCAVILVSVTIATVAICAIGFAAVSLHDCGTDKEHAAAEAAQQRARDDDKACTDPMKGDCTAEARARIAAKQASSSCAEGARKREQWIDTPSADMEGYTPALFHMSAVGSCSTTLRVREKDCSLEYLGEAYGSKPFMLAARSLGFRRLSCGYDEFDLSAVLAAGR